MKHKNLLLTAIGEPKYPDDEARVTPHGQIVTTNGWIIRRGRGVVELAEVNMEQRLVAAPTGSRLVVTRIPDNKSIDHPLWSVKYIPRLYMGLPFETEVFGHENRFDLVGLWGSKFLKKSEGGWPLRAAHEHFGEWLQKIGLIDSPPLLPGGRQLRLADFRDSVTRFGYPIAISTAGITTIPGYELLPLE